MLRRRIFSSAMASVMALSSIAVVANAEETQMKTKADLEKLVNETYGADFRTDVLSEYGSVSADNVLDALEAAEAILADDEADEDDYTVAYKMIEATVSRLVIYTAEELEALIAKAKSAYESNNIYNEELQDRIYTVDTYDALVTAYENAELYVTSTSSVDITEAYEQLNKAYTELSKETVVSKSMFRSVMKQYEAIIDSEFAYETWRRGTHGGWADLNSGNYWIMTSTSGVSSYGIMWEAMMSLKDDINSAYESIDAIKTLSKTSDEDIVAGYKMAQDAVAVFNGWTVDDSSRATKAGVNALLKQYHSCLVYEYSYDTAEALYNAIFAANGVNDEGEPNMAATSFSATYGTVTNYQGWDDPQSKLVDASWNVKSTVNIYVPCDADGYWMGGDLAVGTRPDVSALPDGATKWQLISAKTNFDIVKLVRVNSDNVIEGASFKTYTTSDDGSVIVTTHYTNDNSSGTAWADPHTNTVCDQACEWLYGWGTVVYGETMTHDEDGNRILAANWSTGETEDGSMSRIKYDLQNKTYQPDPFGWSCDPTYTTDDYNTVIKLSTAYALAMDYLNPTDADGDGKVDYFMPDDIDTTGVVANDDAKGNSKEWAIVYRYLKYALEDKYTGSVSSEAYTKADVKALIDDCYDLAELTGDAAIFTKTHNIMVEARQEAKDWVTAANSDKVYKEYTAGTDADGDAYVDSTTAYKNLYGTYEALLKEYNALKYSFGEIYDTIAEVSAMIDDGDLAATDDLLAALDNTAYALSTVSDVVNDSYYDDAAFDADRVFQAHNRAITNTGDAQLIAEINESVTTKDGANPTHAALVTAYDALLAAVKAQTEPTATVGDVNGDGVINALDAAEILKSVVGLATVDATAADYNADGVVNALDASAILQAIVNGTV